MAFFFIWTNDFIENLLNKMEIAFYNLNVMLPFPLSLSLSLLFSLSDYSLHCFCSFIPLPAIVVHYLLFFLTYCVFIIYSFSVSPRSHFLSLRVLLVFVSIGFHFCHQFFFISLVVYIFSALSFLSFYYISSYAGIISQLSKFNHSCMLILYISLLFRSFYSPFLLSLLLSHFISLIDSFTYRTFICLSLYLSVSLSAVCLLLALTK